jgi:hypothetical protein
MFDDRVQTLSRQPVIVTVLLAKLIDGHAGLARIE